MTKPDGYRYIRQYRRRNGTRPWALWEVQNGRARRVGTAETNDEKRAFLGLPAHAEVN